MVSCTVTTEALAGSSLSSLDDKRAEDLLQRCLHEAKDLMRGTQKNPGYLEDVKV